MAVDVITEITIERPVLEVADYAADPGHAPEWYANIASVTWETPPPAQVGTRVTFVANFLGDGSSTPTSSSSWFPANGS